MKTKHKLILSIPQPCTENWDEMTVTERGHFCAHCQKTVTDISDLSDAAIVQLFQERSDVHCIRAFPIQLDRTIALPAQAPTRFYRIAVALGLTIMMAGTVSSYARPKAPLVEQNEWLNQENPNMETDTLKIKGTILDEHNNPFGGAIIKIFIGGVYKCGTVTEDDGTFIIKLTAQQLSDEKFDLQASSGAYETVRLGLKKEDIYSGRDLSINMKVDNNQRGHIIGLLIPNRGIRNAPGQTIYGSDALKKAGF